MSAGKPALPSTEEALARGAAPSWRLAVVRLARSRAFPFLALALGCLVLALAMSFAMAPLAARFPRADWLAFVAMFGYVVFMLTFLLLWDREREAGASHADAASGAASRAEGGARDEPGT